MKKKSRVGFSDPSHKYITRSKSAQNSIFNGTDLAQYKNKKDDRNRYNNNNTNNNKNFKDKEKSLKDPKETVVDKKPKNGLVRTALSDHTETKNSSFNGIELTGYENKKDDRNRFNKNKKFKD